MLSSCMQFGQTSVIENILLVFQLHDLCASEVFKFICNKWVWNTHTPHQFVCSICYWTASQLYSIAFDGISNCKMWNSIWLVQSWCRQDDCSIYFCWHSTPTCCLCNEICDTLYKFQLVFSVRLFDNELFLELYCDDHWGRASVFLIEARDNVFQCNGVDRSLNKTYSKDVRMWSSYNSLI